MLLLYNYYYKKLFYIFVYKIPLFFLEGKTVPKVSATSLARELVASKGLLGLYRGVGATGMRDVTFSIIYFPMFARLNALGPRKKDGSGIYFTFLTLTSNISYVFILLGDAVFWCSFVSGCAAGSSAALAVNPIDVIKTRLQAIKKSDAEVEYKGVVDCFM